MRGQPTGVEAQALSTLVEEKDVVDELDRNGLAYARSDTGEYPPNHEASVGGSLRGSRNSSNKLFLSAYMPIASKRASRDE